MKRVLTALILIPLVLCAVIWGPPWLIFAAVTLVAALCYQEYGDIAAGYGTVKADGLEHDPPVVRPTVFLVRPLELHPGPRRHHPRRRPLRR